MKTRLSIVALASATVLAGVASAAQSEIRIPRERALSPETVEEVRAPVAMPVLGSWRDRVCFDVESDGAIWARGETYKARFGPGGATYYPFFGAQASRNFPVELSLASASADGVDLALAPATSATHDGMRIVIDRGPIDEVYDLALDHVEQTFVIESRPSSGNIRLVVDLRSELARNATSDGIELANEWGSVRYGRAFVREASGARVPLQSRLVDRGVEIEISNEYLANAQFPLTIDPIISTFPVGSPTVNEERPSVAYDVTTDHYLVVYQYLFSQFDHDMVAEAYNSSGSLVAFRTIDFSTEDWFDASCANLNRFDQFLCAALVDIPGAPSVEVWGRTLSAGLLAAGNKFQIASSGSASSLQSVRVGGDPFDGFTPSAFYCVVWKSNVVGHGVEARLVTSSSVLVGSAPTLLATSGSEPRISKSDGQLDNDAAWTIIWGHIAPAGGQEALAMRMRWNGQIMSPPAVVFPGGTFDAHVSSPLADGRTLVVWQEPGSALPHDIFFALLDGTTVQSSGNLTTLEGSSAQPLQQETPRVESDGERFAVAYVDVIGATTGTVWLSSFAPLGTSLEATETRQPLDLVPNPIFTRMDITSKTSSGGTGTRYFVGWDNSGVLDGAFYDRPLGGAYSAFCTAEVATSCPCGNMGAAGHGCANSVFPSGALLSASGVAQLGGDTLSLTISAVPSNSLATLFQGTSTSISYFGDGQLCTSGALTRFGVKSTGAGGTATWPSGSDTPISVNGMVTLTGARRFYQVRYRNAATFCTNAAFNVSNGMNVLWLP